jgi:hypothetical protein
VLLAEDAYKKKPR